MAIFGLLVMISGLALLVIPVGNSDIINFNVQFIGMTLGISGSVIFVGGFLQDNLVLIRKAIEPASGEIAQPQEVKPSESTDGYMLATEYAESKGLGVPDVIYKINNKQLEGQIINQKWYVKS